MLEAEEEMGPLINDQTFIMLMVLGLVAVVGILVVAIASFIGRFQKELKYVNQRIRQAANERERQHYLRRRRRLWWSIIPFVPYDKERRSKKHK